MRDVGGLRCDQVLEVLSDFVDDQLEGEACAQVKAHLAGCPECERFGRGFGSAVLALHQLRDDDSDASDDEELELLGRLRARVAEG